MNKQNEILEIYKGSLDEFQGSEYQFVQTDFNIEETINEFPESKREYLKNEYNRFLTTSKDGEYTGIYGISGKGYDLFDSVYELRAVTKFDKLVYELKEELEPFFETDTLVDGTSQFHIRRLTDFFREVDPDYIPDIQNKVWDQLQSEYDCEILDISTDMGVYIVLHNDYELDLDTGNTSLKTLSH